MLSNYYLIKYIRKKGNEISIDILKKIIYQKKKFFDHQNSIEMLTVANKEIVKYINFYIYDLSLYITNVIMIVLTLISINEISIYLGFIQLLYFPFALIPVKVLTKNISNEVNEIISNNAKINQIKADVIKNIEFVKLNRLEEKKIDELEFYNKKINKVWGKVAALETTSGIWINGFVKTLFIGISFSIGTLLVLRENIKVGELVSLLSYVTLLYGYINTVLNTNINSVKNNAEFDSTLLLLRLPDVNDVGEKEFKFKKCIRFENITFSYNNQRKILQNSTFVFPYNKWTTITGKSGIGKSTIFNLLTKLYDGYSGEILVDDVSLKEINTYELRGHVSKISQDVYLFPGTIKDNLRLINYNISDKDINKLMDFVCLSDYIESLPHKINTDIGEAGKLMSGGEKQRLSLALGLLRNNKVLLLDEITSCLDKETELIIASHLKNLLTKGYTIISISHRVSFNKYSDNIIEIYV